MKKERLNSFSVPLGLLDYGNPVLYTITMTVLLKNLYTVMDRPYNLILLIGAILSVVFGLAIPTGKVIVGLGIIQFQMPVSLVSCVNLGIFLSGLMLLKHAFSLSLPVLLVLAVFLIFLLMLIYRKGKKINTVAVLTGAFGYLMLYIALIALSVRRGMAVPVVCYCLAILLFVMLCGIGIKANLKNPRVHWVIEISNVICQLLVTTGTCLLFS